LTAPFEEFVRTHLPAAPARVLEVGCGQGELTTALAAAGHDVLGIDPLAPIGDRFRRIRLEDLEEAHEFDAVVAARSLHAIRDLASGLDRIAALLRPGGVLVADEIGWDLIDEPTLDWLYGQRRALASAGRGEAPASVDEVRQEWEAAHLGIHGFAALREALAERFEEREFVWTPFLHRLLGGVATEVLEQALIDAQAIRQLGFRYVGVRVQARPRRRASPESGMPGGANGGCG
jgi:SAM-dependent methyltransferase